MINKDLTIKLIKTLQENNMTISSIESFTGGLFASNITSIPGASKVFLGSIVSYDTSVKENLVNVSKETILKDTVVSSSVALEMVSNGAKIFGSDVTVSFTGNAGPTSCADDIPVGIIYIGIKIKDKIYSIKKHFDLDRNTLREEAINVAIEEILTFLGKK